MARTQQSGAGAATIWMIVFVFFWLVSTVWLVIVYTGQEELRSRIARLEGENKELISDSERRSIDLVRERSGGSTVVGLLEQARGATAELATGDATDGVELVRTRRDGLLGLVRDDGLVDRPQRFDDIALLEGMSLLYEAFKSERALRSAAEARVADLDSDVARLVQLTADQKADLDQRAKAISDELVSAEEGRAEYRRDRDAAVAALEQEFDERRQQTDSDLTHERQQRASAEKRAQDLRARLKFMEARFKDQMIGPEPLATARQPDGRVLTAIPGDDMVYINLGAEDHLTLGLQFAVYSQATGIPPDGRAKALIEVVSIAPSSSECRIARVARGYPILAGDLIANPAYDRDRAPSFVVVGRFDLDHDGAADADGVHTVESIITTWGGDRIKD